MVQDLRREKIREKEIKIKIERWRVKEKKQKVNLSGRGICMNKLNRIENKKQCNNHDRSSEE